MSEVVAKDSMEGDSTGAVYTIRPNPKSKFRPANVSKLIHAVLVEKLTGATYHPDTCSQYSRDIADEIKHQLKALNFPRYKYVVTVTIGESRGAGVRMGCRLFWDEDTDNLAQDTFVNDSLYCVAVGMGIVVIIIYSVRSYIAYPHLPIKSCQT